MVNREKYHGTKSKITNLLKLSPYELENMQLLDLRQYLQKNFPEVLIEMDNSKRYSSWVEPDIPTCFIDFIKVKGKKVGFVAIDVAYNPSFNQSMVCLSKVYILEEYRGQGLFADYVQNLLNLSMNSNYFMIGLVEPNRYTINTMLDHQLLYRLDNGLIIGQLGLTFVIKTKTKLGATTSLSTFTPFYDSNLYAPVQLIDGQLRIGSTCFIDEWDFNAKEDRQRFLDSEKYLRQLGDNIVEIGKIVDNFIAEEVFQINSEFGKGEL